MSRPKVYIDGREGTTGLQIWDRLADREDIELLVIGEEKRKDPAERKKFLNAADLVFLCLPDAAAKEAVALLENPHTRVVDASTAHRVSPDWAYGFPELSQLYRERIRGSRLVSNPGCHATGFISIVYPLVAGGMLPADAPLTCFSLTGYSGGGKKMIGEYESQPKEKALYAPRIYGLNQQHKHLAEMQVHCALERAPVFCPIVDDYYKGMATTVAIPEGVLPQGGAQEVWQLLSAHYEGQAMVKVEPLDAAEPMIAANAMAGKDSLHLLVRGGQERLTVTALFDNLGKGASGAAVQNMNLMLGMDETLGLTR